MSRHRPGGTNAFEPLPRQCGFDHAAWFKLGKWAAGHSRVDRPSAFGGKECMTFRAAPSAAQPEMGVPPGTLEVGDIPFDLSKC